MNTRECVSALIDGVVAGKSMDVFEQFYADDIIMNWNGVDDRVGKAANREFREFFSHNVEFHDIRVESVLVDGDQAAIEWVYEVTPFGGTRQRRKHVVVQTWKGGKIIRQAFYVPGQLWPT